MALLAVAAFAQSSPSRIPPEVAATHLLQAPRPDYPQLAEIAGIQGNVLLEIDIDESGKVSVRQLISGHPMLVPAAVNAASRWKYQPFQVKGKPAAVRTLVLIPFGNAAAHSVEDRAEMTFQNDFWMAEESAEAALAKGDYAHTQEQLDKAQDLVSANSKETGHTRERWQWMTTMGRLRMAQKKNEEAEQYFKQALALREHNKGEDKDSPAIAASLANLAALYAEEKRFDLAHDHAVRALAILQRNFKKGGNPAAQQAYGRGIAQESLLLLKLAKERSDTAEADKQCRTILVFQSFLAAADRDSAVSACEPRSTPPAGQKP